MTPNDLLAAGYRMSAAFVHRMLDDLTPEEFECQPLPGANCAAWVVGHLALTLRNTLRRLGATDLPTMSDEVVSRLKTTRAPAGEQGGYGDPKALLAAFDACIERLQAAVRILPESALDAASDIPIPFPNNRGEAILFGAFHIMLHAGQLSKIRRSLGKPPVV
jgi:DinB superfamily